MVNLQYEQFRFYAFGRRAWYDLFNALLLVALAASLFPAWGKLGGGPQWEVVGQMASPMLPMALGFVLAYRYGTVDLSIWALAGATGLVTAGCVHLGLSPATACGMGVLAGILVGGINAVVVTYVRLPGILLTAVVGVVVLAAARQGVDRPAVDIPERTFDPWIAAVGGVHRGVVNEVLIAEGQPPVDHATIEGPLTTIRMLLSVGLWAVTLLGLMIADLVTVAVPRPFARWWVRPASLIACGALAGASGVLWVIDQGRAPMPTRLVDDATVPVAAILAGLFLLQGRGRTMLVGIFLPVCMLLTSMWEQTILPMPFYGYALQVALLGLMVAMGQAAFLWAMEKRTWKRKLAWIACGLCIAGVLSVAATTRMPYNRETPLWIAGLSVWTVGSAILGVIVLRTYRMRKRKSA